MGRLHGTIKWQNFKKRQSKSPKESDLLTDSASDHVQNEKETKREKKTGQGEEASRKKRTKKKNKREAD